MIIREFKCLYLEDLKKYIYRNSKYILEEIFSNPDIKIFMDAKT